MIPPEIGEVLAGIENRISLLENLHTLPNSGMPKEKPLYGNIERTLSNLEAQILELKSDQSIPAKQVIKRFEKSLVDTIRKFNEHIEGSKRRTKKYIYK